MGSPNATAPNCIKIINDGGIPDEDILGDLSPCGLRSPNFENLDLPGWVGGGRMVISVCAGGLV